MRRLVLILMALSGCMAVEPLPAKEPAPRALACGANDLQHLVGQSESVLAAMTFARPMRLIHPGVMITMDHNPGRLNINIGSSGKITRVWCG